MAITFSSDYLYVLAMLKTTPLMVTIGLSLTIPVAVAGDFLLQRSIQAQVIAGALLVFLGFMMIGFENSRVGTRRVPRTMVEQ
jgi:solute carrier family 35 protein F5